MNSGRYIPTQVLDLVERKALTRLADRYNIRARLAPVLPPTLSL
jgi:hypothetical protein